MEFEDNIMVSFDEKNLVTNVSIEGDTNVVQGIVVNMIGSRLTSPKARLCDIKITVC